MPKAKKPLPCTQKTSFCPRCGKRFGNKIWVLQHMNQPSSACGTILNDISLSRPTVLLPLSSHIIHDAHQTSPEAASGTPMDLDMPNDTQELDIPNDTHELDLQHMDGPDITPENVEYFPGASQSYSGGETFMDQFFSDKHGKFRKENLFYLFASQQDWQIASWLLHSCLSMAAIDSFLSLDLVSYIQLYRAS